MSIIYLPTIGHFIKLQEGVSNRAETGVEKIFQLKNLHGQIGPEPTKGIIYHMPTQSYFVSLGKGIGSI